VVVGGLLYVLICATPLVILWTLQESVVFCKNYMKMFCRAQFWGLPNLMQYIKRLDIFWPILELDYIFIKTLLKGRALISKKKLLYAPYFAYKLAPIILFILLSALKC
jgi:hypothetical protein